MGGAELAVGPPFRAIFATVSCVARATSFRFGDIVAELVDLKVDVIVSSATRRHALRQREFIAGMRCSRLATFGAEAISSAVQTLLSSDGRIDTAP